MKVVGGLDSWQWKLLNATDDNSRKCRAIVRSSLHNNGVGAHTFPRYAYDSAIITPEGDVMTRACMRQGDDTVTVTLGPVKELIGDFRRLADELKLSDVDRMNLFLCFRQWFKKDYRATSNMKDDYK